MVIEDFEERFNLDEAHRGGNSAEFGLRIETISIQFGEPLALSRDGITLIVGGNNSGKSTLLRQMHESITSYSSNISSDPRLLSSQEVELRGSLADVHAWMAANSFPSRNGYLRHGVEVTPELLNHILKGRDGHFRELGQVTTLAASARSRFDAANPVQKRADFSSPPSSDLHYFEDSLELQAELSDYCEKIFGVGLTLDPLSGEVMFRFGTPTVAAPPVTNVTSVFREDLSKLAPINEQGDGVASTLGLLIPLLAGQNQIAFVDEPEAYLHPPQAFKLGQILASITARNSSQLVVATHDKNFVAGVLANKVVDSTIIRLERVGESTTGYRVEPEQIDGIWSSPLLRHSNVLDGLFHRAVVVAEDARDCLFYAAALEAAAPLESGMIPTDVLFLSSNGKGGVAEIASILTAAHVPVIAVLDMDAIRDKQLLKRIVGALQTEWTSILETKYDLATAEFRQPRKRITKATANARISTVLSAEPEEYFDEPTRKAILDAISVANPWSEVKKYGVAAFKAERKAADETLDHLANAGIVLVPSGELESLAPSLQVKKGPEWVAEALRTEAHRNAPAVDLARAIVAAISHREVRWS